MTKKIGSNKFKYFRNGSFDSLESLLSISESLSDGDFEEDTKYEENVIEAETDWMNISSDSKKLYKIIDIDSSSETESLEWDECELFDASFNESS